MQQDALLSMLSLEIGQLRGQLLGSHYLLSPETIATAEQSIEPLTVPLVYQGTPPGCLVSVITFAIGVLATIHLPFIGWVVGPFIIIGILFHKGIPTYYCSNCTTELTYETAKVCPGSGAEFTGVERRGSGNKYGIWILILVGVFYLFGAVL